MSANFCPACGTDRCLVLPAANMPPAPIDWPARFRRAARAVHLMGQLELSADLMVISTEHPDVLAAVGRALLGEES